VAQQRGKKKLEREEGARARERVLNVTTNYSKWPLHTAKKIRGPPPDPNTPPRHRHTR
jgi:hypothetical protein